MAVQSCGLSAIRIDSVGNGSKGAQVMSTYDGVHEVAPPARKGPLTKYEKVVLSTRSRDSNHQGSATDLQLGNPPLELRVPLILVYELLDANPAASHPPPLRSGGS